MSNQYIGIFDSGIGGLTVAKSIIKKLPHENVVYFGDTAHLPYGTKTREEIIGYVESDVEFLNRFDLKAIVIACNTADSTAREIVEGKYDIPVFGVVKPASKVAASTTRNNRIGVIATNATVSNKAYEKVIREYNPDAEVYSVACPKLVTLVEEGRYSTYDDDTVEALKEYLTPLKEKGIDTLVLGCTHFPLLEAPIQHFLPDVKIISSSEAAACVVKETLERIGNVKQEGDPDRIYFVSSDPEWFTFKASIFMGRSFNKNVTKADI